MIASIQSRFELALSKIELLDAAVMGEAQARLDQLTKPPGSLGRLEALAVQLAGITGRTDSSVRPRRVLVMAADHGVAVRGVSAYPASVTGQMVRNFLTGGAAINSLARAADADVLVTDVGVATLYDVPAVLGDRVEFVSRRVALGSADMTLERAMTIEQVWSAIEVGMDAVEASMNAGVRVLGVGEMGIGNTTAASAITAVMTGEPVAAVTGRGTGLADDGLRHKIEVVDAALARHRPERSDPITVLGSVGGLEIAALVGAITAGAAAGLPVVLDGFITGAAALVAVALRPGLGERLIASHRSAEPGHRAALRHLGLAPLLELDLRLGEGTGAVLAFGLLDAAVAIRDGMATFASAEVSGRSESPQPDAKQSIG